MQRTNDSTTVQLMQDSSAGLREQRDLAHVVAAFVENLLAGLGVAILVLGVGAVASLFYDWPIVTSLIVALAVGGIGFGILCVIRFASDEWRIVRYMRKLEAQLTRQQMRIGELEQANANLAYDNERLRSELGNARVRLERGFVQADEPVTLNRARVLLDRVRDGLPYSKHEVCPGQMTEREWRNAMGLFTAAKLLEKDGTKWKIVVDGLSETEVLDALREASSMVL